MPDTSGSIVATAGDATARDGTTAPLISVVVPVYKEQKSIVPFLERMAPTLEKLGSYEILFCLDPCPDKTEEVIRECAADNPNVGLMVFSRRFGQPAATMAGILNCRGQWCVVIDVDLQDPPEVILDLWKKAAAENLDVVTARRANRDGETMIKKAVSEIGYSFINSVADVTIPRNTGDFRLMSRRVIEELRQLKESHGFLRGLVSVVGFKQGEVLYERDARLLGESNYNKYLGSLKIAFNGVFGFSTFPLQFMLWGGIAMAIASFFAIMVVFALKLIKGENYPLGIPTIQVLVLFMGGVQLAGIGVLGEYIGRIYDEVRMRPMYIVDRALNIDVQAPRGPNAGK